MKTIALTPIEFDSFKKLANFFFDMMVKRGFIYVTASADHLDQLGY